MKYFFQTFPNYIQLSVVVFQTHREFTWLSPVVFREYAHILKCHILIIDKDSCLPLSQLSVCNITEVDGKCWNMFSVILEGVTLWDPMQSQNGKLGNFRLGVMKTGYRNRDSSMCRGWTKFVQRFFKRVGWLEWWSIAGSIQRDFTGGTIEY